MRLSTTTKKILLKHEPFWSTSKRIRLLKNVCQIPPNVREFVVNKLSLYEITCALSKVKASAGPLCNAESLNFESFLKMSWHKASYKIFWSFLIPFSFVFSSHLFSHFWKVWKEQQEKRCVGTKGSSVFWA